MLNMKDKLVKDIVAGKLDDGKGKTIELDGFISNITCKKCGKELPMVKMRELLDDDHPVHVCPHELTYEYRIQEEV